MSANNLSWSTRAAGRPSTFIAAVVIVLLWAITGPLFTTGVTWQLVTNTGIAISTLLVVFLIQNIKNRATNAARNTIIDLKELQTIRKHHLKLSCKARTKVKRGKDGVAIEG